MARKRWGFAASGTLRGTCRAHDPAVRDQIEARFRQILDGLCAAHGVRYRLDYQACYSAAINTPGEAERAARAAASIVDEENVIRNLPPSMGAEEFAWMLRERPRCYVRLGNGGADGHGSCVVHNARYDFNDEALPVGASFWAALVEQELCSQSD